MINRIEITQNNQEIQHLQKFFWKKITVDGRPLELTDEEATEIMELLEKTKAYRNARRSSDAYSE